MSTDNQDFKTYVEAELKYLRGRIDNGISPTMQAVKDQNAELSKDILRLENKLISLVHGIETRVGIMDEHFSGPLKEYENLKDKMMGFFFKIAMLVLVCLGGTFFGVWTFVNQIKARLDLYPQGKSALIDSLKAVPLKNK